MGKQNDRNQRDFATNPVNKAGRNNKNRSDSPAKLGPEKPKSPKKSDSGSKFA